MIVLGMTLGIKQIETLHDGVYSVLPVYAAKQKNQNTLLSHTLKSKSDDMYVYCVQVQKEVQK